MTMEASAAVLTPAQPRHEVAFNRIHQEYRPRILRYLTRLVGALDAEDLTQMVFARVSDALRDFRGDSSLATWIYRIAQNAAGDWRRNAARTAALHQEVAADAMNTTGAEINTGFSAPDDALIRRDMQQCLGRVVEELPDAYRDVLTLRVLDGLSNAAIAEALGLSLATVKIRVHRARGQLRDTMAARCVVSRDGRRGLTCERKERF